MIAKKNVLPILALLITAFILPCGSAMAANAIDNVKLSAERLPANWRLSEEIRVPEDRLQQFEDSLFSPLDEIVNQIFLTQDGSKVQVNYIACPSRNDTSVVYQNLIEKVGAVNVVVIVGHVVIEIVAGEDSQKQQVLALLPLSPLQKSKLTAIHMPPDWRIVREYFLRKDQTSQIASRLNCRIDEILNQFILAEENRLRINYLTAPSAGEAAKAYENLNALVGEVNLVLQRDRVIIEVICQDSAIVDVATRLLQDI